MQPYAFLAQDDAAFALMHGANKARSAELIVQDNVGLADVMESEPAVDGIAPCLTAELWGLPSGVQSLGNFC